MEEKGNSISSNTQSNSHLDDLLNKYVSVWLWSILFAPTTGILYSLLSLRYDRWGPLGLILAIPGLLSLLLAILALLTLYRALAGYLLPRFILNDDADPHFFAYLIRRGFLYFIYAASFRAVASLLEIALAASKSTG